MPTQSAENMTDDGQSENQPVAASPTLPLKNKNLLKTVKTENSIRQNGDIIRANADVFGKQNMRLEAALLESGEQLLHIPFAKDNFTLDQLFSDFSLPTLDLFVFNDVDIQIDAHPQASKPTIVNFSGKLDISKSPLKEIAAVLGIKGTPLLTASIQSGDTDLSDKLQPQSVTFKSESTLEVQVVPGVYLGATAFELRVDKNNDDKWEITPGASGTLELTELGHGNGEITAYATYENRALLLKGTAAKIDNAFFIPGLTLSNLALNCELGKSKEINVNAELHTDKTTYNLAGAVTEENAGVYLSIGRFNGADLSAIFSAINLDSLQLPELNFELTDIVLGFASAAGDYAGETLEAGATVSASARILDIQARVDANIQQQGIAFSGSLGNLDVGSVQINKAALNLNCYAKSANKHSSISVVGEATIEGIEVDCKLVFQEENGQWQKIVYAGVNADAFTMSTIFPKAKNSFIDNFSFTRLAFIYSSFDGKATDPDFDFNVKKGLQLLGNMNQIPALSDLTGSDNLNLQLQAYFGTETGIVISLPDTRLNLGPSVTTDPFSVGVVFLPSPALDLVFGMDVKVPRQQLPLHFDLSLSVGVIQASGAGTMKNYWVNPFGLRGLKIGPELALEVGIIYQQFISTGTPSSFGFVGGLALGDVTAQMAMKISAIPSEQILMGSLEKLSPQNLIAFINQATGATISPSALPDIIDIQDLEIYIAPTGGSIGTVTFDQGFSFDADMVLFNKAISMHARLGEDGISAEGSMDRIAIGPLTIQGRDGGEAQFDFDLTISRQAISIDGEFDFLGSGVGIFADISINGIEFAFEQRFLGLMSYSVEGISSGNITKPKSLDFALAAEFDNDITAYLKNDLSKKIDTASKAASESIEDAQARVEQAEKAYEKELNKAKQALDIAKGNADALASQLNAELTKARQTYNQSIKAAKAELTRAKAAYDNALKDAQAAVDVAEATYNKAMSDAQAAVDKAQRTYNNGISIAQNNLNKAERDYENTVGSAQRTLDAAIRKVNSLNSSISKAKKNLKKAKKWPPNPFKVTQYTAEIAGLETAKVTANIALNAAKVALSGVSKGAQFAALTSARAALEVAKQGANLAAFNGAKAALEVTKRGAQYTAFTAAKATLNAVKTGSEYTAWKAAEQSLNAARMAGSSAVNAAQENISNIGKTSIYIAFDAAKAGMDAVKQGSSFIAFETAKAALEGAKQSAGVGLELANYIATHSGDIVDVRSVHLSGHLKGLLKGDFFVAKVDMSVFGKTCKTTVDFDVQHVDSFLEGLFKEALTFFKKAFN